MNDTKKREVYLQELKKLREELLEKRNDMNETTSFNKLSQKTYQKKASGIASKMYEKDKGEAAKVQVLMLALLTFLFEMVFFVGSYLIFR